MTGAECREDDLRLGALDLLYGVAETQWHEAAEGLLDSLGWMIWYTFGDHISHSLDIVDNIRS